MNIDKKILHSLMGFILCTIANETINQYAIQPSNDVYFRESIYPTGFEVISQFYI